MAYARKLNFRAFLQALAGVILLGTPHSTSEGEDTWENAAWMVQGDSWKKKKHPIYPEDVKLLATSSLHFEQARASVPILSAYETQKSKVKLFLQNKQILVSIFDRFNSHQKYIRIPKLSLPPKTNHTSKAYRQGFRNYRCQSGTTTRDPYRSLGPLPSGYSEPTV